MNNIIKYIFIGFVQGFTEFLPISSSGHIVLFGSILDLSDLMALSIIAHIGTLLALIYCYKDKLIPLIKKPFNKTNLYLIIATLPAVISVLVFRDRLEQSFSIHTVVIGFIISGIILAIADIIKNKNKKFRLHNALIMGIGQTVALLPGISRSGTTLAFGLISGTDKEETLDFSFLMSIPIILGSAVFEGYQLISCGTKLSWVSIFVVLTSSFFFGILSIKFMLKIVKNNSLFYFSIYLLILSAVLLIVL